MTGVLFCAVALVANAVVMSVEMLSTRLLFPIFGNTVFTWSAVISIIIAGLFLGYMAGGCLSDRRTSLARLVFLELLAAGLLVAAVPWLCDKVLLPSSMMSTPPLAGCFLVFGLPAAALASTGPAVVGILARRGWSAPLAAGVVSSLAAAGSIAGTLLTTFTLIPAFGVRGLFAAFGAALWAMALAVAWTDRQGVSTGKAVVGLGLSAAAALGLSRAAAFPPRTLAADPVFSKDSGYQLVRVFEQGAGPSLLRVLMLDSTQEGAMRIASKEVIFEYTAAYRLLVNALSRHAEPSVLFIGGGAYAMPLAVASELPRSTVEVAEVDPVVEDVGRMFFRTGEVPNLRTLLADGRRALRDGARYDGIFVDAYQGVMAIPFHLTTREFFEEARAALKPGGVVGLNVIGRIDEKEGLLCAITGTLRSVFPEVRLHPVRGPGGGSQNVIMVASGLPAAAVDGLLAGTAFARGIRPEALRCSPGQVLTDDHAPVEWLASRYLR